jgi:hypothetical protein
MLRLFVANLYCCCVSNISSRSINAAARRQWSSDKVFYHLDRSHAQCHLLHRQLVISAGHYLRTCFAGQRDGCKRWALWRTAWPACWNICSLRWCKDDLELAQVSPDNPVHALLLQVTAVFTSLLTLLSAPKCCISCQRTVPGANCITLTSASMLCIRIQQWSTAAKAHGHFFAAALDDDQCQTHAAHWHVCAAGAIIADRTAVIFPGCLWLRQHHAGSFEPLCAADAAAA